MKAGFVEAPSKAPPTGPKNGTTGRCTHEGCPMVIVFKNGVWLHSIRNRPYDHEASA